MSKRAIIEIHEGTYVRTIWHLEGSGYNVLGWMFKPEGEEWNIGYRFRYYVDGKAFGSADRKSVYRLRPTNPTPTEADLTSCAAAMDATFHELVERLRLRGEFTQIERLDVNALGPAATAVIVSRPWAHSWGPGSISTDPKPPGRA